MTTTNFKSRFLEQYLIELLGNKDNTVHPLLTKNLSQKTKYNLKKLADEVRKSYNDIKEQVRTIFDKYAEEYEDEAGKKMKRIKKENEETAAKEFNELEEMDVSILHYPFEEKDFIDKSTGEVVADETYYNIIDILIYDKVDAVQQG